MIKLVVLSVLWIVTSLSDVNAASRDPRATKNVIHTGYVQPVFRANTVNTGNINTTTTSQISTTTNNNAVNIEKTVVPEKKQNPKERERNICMSNNIGIGNTFVWAARDVNLNNYSTMIEDIENPENNTCYVKVSVDTRDNKIDVSDIQSKYFEMGKTITCASWADEEKLTERILEAKKGARIGGTIAATVGGAGIGVGAMELFGNKLIGGKVMGQKALEGQELLRSQILVLKKDNQSEYNRIVKALEDLESVCKDDSLWENTGMIKPSDCDVSNPFIGLREKLN